jgi:hypothetical protein
MFFFRSREPRREASISDDDLRFKVVRVNGHDEVVARAVNLLIGRAAYETARRLYEGERVDYRDGARIIATSRHETKAR